MAPQAASCQALHADWTCMQGTVYRVCCWRLQVQAARGLAKTAECLRDLKSALVGKELELTATWHEQVEACAQGSGSAAMLLTLWKQFQVEAPTTCASVAQPPQWCHCCPACHLTRCTVIATAGAVGAPAAGMQSPFLHAPICRLRSKPGCEPATVSSRRLPDRCSAWSSAVCRQWRAASGRATCPGRPSIRSVLVLLCALCLVQVCCSPEYRLY